MDSPLLECRQKLERAKEHRQAICSKIRRFLDSRPYSLIREYNAETATYWFKLKITEPIPHARWAVIIGDCVHNARSSLDYIAWKLAGSELTDWNTLFPICKTLPEFQKSVKGRLRRIHQEALIEIQECQPFTKPHPETELLWFLQELDARDKHKLLTMTQTITHAVQSTRYWSGDGSSDIIFNRDGRLDNDSIVAGVRFPIGTLESDVDHVDLTPFYDIAFERGILASSRAYPPAYPRAYPVDRYLSKIIGAVDEIIIRFEGLLVRNPHWIS